MASPKVFFAENQNLFSNAGGNAEQQEKYNLYGGLYALAEEVERINRNLRGIENALYDVENRVKNKV